MYLLCKNLDGWGEWIVLSAGACKESLQSKADELNKEEYEASYAEWAANAANSWEPLPLNDPRRNGYRTFDVIEVPDWPSMS